MMYAKLIVRNLKRSTKEYMLYFMTLTICVTLMYAFNGLAFSNQVSQLAKTMDAMAGGIVVSSVIIVLVMGWLVYYISNFILQKRSHEFGMYMLMGMTRKQITNMFLLEQVCMGLIAFVVGCVLGVVVYQVLIAILMNLFHSIYSFQIDFNWQSALLTFFYFFMIYLVELIRDRNFLKKRNITTLLYSNRINETAKKSGKLSVLCFIFGIMAYFVGLRCLQLGFQNEIDAGVSLFGGVGSICFSIFLIYFGLSYVITQCIQRKKNIKYKGNALYLSAQICTRLRTSRMVLALLSVLTLSTFLLVSMGMKFNASIDDSLNLRPFDISASTYSGEDEINPTSILEYLEEHDIAYQAYTYHTYELDIMHKDIVKGIAWEERYKNAQDYHYISYTDYVTLAKMLNEKVHPMKEGEYLILTPGQFEDILRVNSKGYTFLDLQCAGVVNQNLGLTLYDAFIFVVPDVVLKGVDTLDKGQFVVKTEEESTQKWGEDILEPFSKDNKGYVQLVTRYEWVTQSIGSSSTIMFCLIYLAIIFACVSATVLSVQQMSDVWKQRSSYHMLWKMGVCKREIYSLLRKQIALYFFMPFILPVLYLFPIIKVLDTLFLMSYSYGSMVPYACFSIMFYLGIYLCYYFLAYFNSKQSICISSTGIKKQ
ncbi:FtsX-like permease family protein [Amedibacillus sp. YH-ame10]